MTNVRPQTEKEMQKWEVVGVFRASRFVRKYAKSHNLIKADVIYQMHKKIFAEAWPEIAGVLRKENISRISGSDHVPPHWKKVPEAMQEVDDKIHEYTDTLASVKMDMQNSSNEPKAPEAFQKILQFAAYVHHAITYVHPFREGNGRTARLAANLVLERYGLVGISIKVERENKNHYCDALAQIDKFNDFEPLLNLMAEGLIDRYNGVQMEFIKE